MKGVLVSATAAYSAPELLTQPSSDDEIVITEIPEIEL
jgi:hypothetical protein